MATYEKRGDRWRASVCVSGTRKSKSFDTKAQAKAWAAMMETDLHAKETGVASPSATFGNLLERYRDEVSPGKSGARWETIRINRILGLGKAKRDRLADVLLSEIDAPDIGAWRDRRLKEVKAGAVLREWTLLSGACTVAVNEWKWLAKHPMKGVKRPATPEARDRRISEDEIERMMFAAGYHYDRPPLTTTARVGAAVLFAIETGMRAGEIVALRWEDVELDSRFLRVAGHAGGRKTDAAKREVPLSTEAIRLLNQLSEIRAGDKVFQIGTTQSLDTLFRSKIKDRAGIVDLHFHDTRAEAITRLAKRIDVLTLARMVGHRDIKMLQVYYRESAVDVADRLG